MVTIVSTPHGDTCLVFRSVVTGKPWDQFEPWHGPSASSSSTAQPTSAVYLLRACSSSTTFISYEDHINMGWDHSIESPYISFSRDLEWAIYYQLKQEHIDKNNPSRARHLYALEVLADDVECVAHTLGDLRARSNSNSASEVLGTLQVRVVRKLSLMDEIPLALRETSLDWFRGRKQVASVSGDKAKYPFTEWRSAMRSLCQQDLDMVARAVTDWFSPPTPTPANVPHSAVIDLSQVDLDENTPLLPAGAHSNPPPSGAPGGTCGRNSSKNKSKQPGKSPKAGNAGPSDSNPAGHPHAPLPPTWQVRITEGLYQVCQLVWTGAKWVVAFKVARWLWNRFWR